MVPSTKKTLTAEERAEVARIEKECSALERRMRDLPVTQQRSLLENLANASSAVIGGLLADAAQMRGKGAKGGGQQKVKANQASANKGPKYLEDLSRGLSHTEAFVRHHSRPHDSAPNGVWRGVTPAPSHSGADGQAASAKSWLEQRGVTWTQEGVDRCLTMELFFDCSRGCARIYKGRTARLRRRRPSGHRSA